MGKNRDLFITICFICLGKSGIRHETAWEKIGISLLPSVLFVFKNLEIFGLILMTSSFERFTL